MLVFIQQAYLMALFPLNTSTHNYPAAPQDGPFLCQHGVNSDEFILYPAERFIDSVLMIFISRIC